MLLLFTNQNQDFGWVPTWRHPRYHHPACGGTAACAICKPSLPGRSQTPGTQQWLARKTILTTWMMMPSSTSWNLFEEELWNAFRAYTCSLGGQNSRLDTAGNHPVWSNSHLPQRNAGEWPTINGNITCPRLACHLSLCDYFSRFTYLRISPWIAYSFSFRIHNEKLSDLNKFKLIQNLKVQWMLLLVNRYTYLIRYPTSP